MIPERFICEAKEMHGSRTLTGFPFFDGENWWMVRKGRRKGDVTSVVIRPDTIKSVRIEAKNEHVSGFLINQNLCPNCGSILVNKYYCCPHCGMALDWSREE